MDANQQSLQELQQIKQMMERSSKFISLSGLSGISAGICALAGAAFTYPYIYEDKDFFINWEVGIVQLMAKSYSILLNTWIFWIAIFTFLAALISAFIFTWIRSKKEGIPIWGYAAKRVMINVAIPLLVGGIFIFRLAASQDYSFAAPGCLIFYGLALLNASKYTLGEIRYLGYGQIILGIINLWMIGYGLYFWAAGFGLLHIIYGVVMWSKYERGNDSHTITNNE